MTYIIVYPNSDKTKLTVARIDGLTRHREDFCVASGKEFKEDSEESAWVYCRELAKKHSLKIMHDTVMPDYLD